MKHTLIPKLQAGALKTIPRGEIKELLQKYLGCKGEFREQVRGILEKRLGWEEYHEQLQEIPEDRRGREYQKGDFSGTVRDILEINPNYYSLNTLEFEEIKLDFTNRNMQVSIDDLQEDPVRFEFIQRSLEARGFDNLEQVFSGEETEEKIGIRHYLRKGVHGYETESIEYLNSIEGFPESESYLDLMRYFSEGDVSLFKKIFELYSVESDTDIDNLLDDVGVSFILGLNRNSTNMFNFLISYFDISSKEDFLKLFNKENFRSLDVLDCDLGSLQSLFERLNIQSIHDANYMFNGKNFGYGALRSSLNIENFELLQMLINLCEVNNIEDFSRAIEKYLGQFSNGGDFKSVFPILKAIYSIEDEEDLDEALKDDIFKRIARLGHYETLQFFIEEFNLDSPEKLKALVDIKIADWYVKRTYAGMEESIRNCKNSEGEVTKASALGISSEIMQEIRNKLGDIDKTY